MELTFYKETRLEHEHYGKWFVDFPQWEGPKEDLEMVAGADKMLEELSVNENDVHLELDEKGIEEPHFKLSFNDEYCDGGLYSVNTIDSDYKDLDNMEIWLCYVTKYIFGYLPEIIYCKHMNFLNY